MQIKYVKTCYDSFVEIGGRDFSELSTKELKDIVIKMIQTETISKEKMIELIEIFGHSSECTECDQCGDFNYEVVWR